MPASTLKPPKLTKQYGERTDSNVRAGSQNPIVIPGIGGTNLHMQMGFEGFSMSLNEDPATTTSPMDMGKMQSQQMSVIGLMNFPTHVADWALLENKTMASEAMTIRSALANMLEPPLARNQLVQMTIDVAIYGTAPVEYLTRGDE
jgi:hypothetical protein